MASHHHIGNVRIRVDDDGQAAVEIVMATDGGRQVDVIAEWSIDYLPSAAQDRVRAALADENGNEPPLDVPTNRPDTGPGTHPRN